MVPTMATTRKKTAPRGPGAPKSPPDDDRKARAREVRKRLRRALPEPVVELDFESPWQLLVATILAARNTDRNVNRVTPALFRRFPTPAALAAAPSEEVQELVRSTGFFRNKTKSIQGASRAIAEEHGGEVPRTMEEMLALPGVARKTANVVLGAAYGVATGIVVDVHCARLAARLGLTRSRDPVEVEQDLCAVFPRTSWIEMSHRLVLHGRYVCVARTPRCSACPLAEICPAREAQGEGRWTVRADREAEEVLAQAYNADRPRVGGSQLSGRRRAPGKAPGRRAAG